MTMRWSGQQIGSEAPNALPGLARLNNLVRTVRTPEFDGVTFYEVLAKSALNRVPTSSALHLKPGTKEWYFHWLEGAHPELVPKYLAMYANGTYAPKEYRKWLAAKLKPIILRHGLQRAALDPTTGIVGSRAHLRTRNGNGERSLIAEELPPELAARAMPQPMLF